MSRWIYVVVLGDGEQLVQEVGPCESATAAVEIGANCMGRTAGWVAGTYRVDDLSTYEDSTTLIGFLVERYEAKTDGSWDLSGRLRKATRTRRPISVVTGSTRDAGRNGQAQDGTRRDDVAVVAAR
jgi:hypothetical protein